jgi:hypothetical protein
MNMRMGYLISVLVIFLLISSLTRVQQQLNGAEFVGKLLPNGDAGRDYGDNSSLAKVLPENNSSNNNTIQAKASNKSLSVDLDKKYAGIR